MFRFKITLFIVLFLFAINSYALKKVGKAGFKFLDVGIGARAAGTGSAYIVNGDNPEAVFFNPAGIAKFEKQYGFSFGYTKWIADISYNAASFVYNAKSIGRFGLFFVSPSYPEIEGTIVADNEVGFIETGKFSVSAFAVGLSYARALTDKFMIGGNIKYATQDLGDMTINDKNIKNDASTFAVDFGTIFYPKFTALPTFGFAMTVRNFSPDVKIQEKEFQLPLTYIIGFSVDVFDILGDVKEDQSLNLEVDAIHPRDYTERLNVGLEFIYREMFIVRTGYKFNYDEESLTFGLGLKKGPIVLDYSYGSFGAFSSVSRVSLGFVF